MTMDMKNHEIKIKHDSSSLSEFVKRPLPNDEEVEAFDKYVVNEAKEEEIKNSLARIYQDDQGKKLDIKTLTVKRARGFFFNLVTFIIVMFVLSGAVYAAYNYIYLNINADKQTIVLSFAADREVMAGEEFYYILNYKNEDKVAINNIEIKVKYPDNFIFLDNDPENEKSFLFLQKSILKRAQRFKNLDTNINGFSPSTEITGINFFFFNASMELYGSYICPDGKCQKILSQLKCPK